MSASRSELRATFSALGADHDRYIWELRPFNTSPFLRLEDDGGLLLLGRPWIQNWLGQGFHYRAMSAAQFAEQGYAVHGDLLGSGTEQVIIYTDELAAVYAGEPLPLAAVHPGRPLPQPKRLYSSTLYPGGEVEL